MISAWFLNRHISGPTAGQTAAADCAHPLHTWHKINDTQYLHSGGDVRGVCVNF